MNHLSLFSGVGGIDLAATWAGFHTVAFCEQNKFCQQVLNKHWPEVPIFDDIFELSAESLERRGIRSGSLESSGYSARAVVIPACGVGAFHRRERVFIIAYSMRGFSSAEQERKREEMGFGENPLGNGEKQRLAGALAYPTSKGLEGYAGSILPGQSYRPTSSDRWPIEPNVGRVATGVPRRVDRLRALGNAVVPQQVYPILKAIADYETEVAA
jgi:DNA (cytosine-5)-methyltransferase 1